MAEYRYFHIDAFAEKPMMGNQAAVMPMDSFLPDEQLQAIAAENNFAETAYIVKTSDDSWDLRWFTPSMEVPLCGHATLASAHVLFNHLGFKDEAIKFDTRQSGRLVVRKLDDGRLEMDFPADMPKRIEIPRYFAEAVGADPNELWQGSFLLAVFNDPNVVRHLDPDLDAFMQIAKDATGDPGNLICAAPTSGDFDVVSRVFAPGSGIPEDPATGSAHCLIAPFFSDKLGKDELTCCQAFPGRGGVIGTRCEGDRVKLMGNSVTVVEGVFRL
ncbi:MAG: PhzF family phenazine biosynthesis protein [Hirschia sp.]|nr:PhzF family phenazine biosynthesis protein [Hirschia sp.]MBF19387.1 PhzF family phenazine biosynthesis protein [Hirschia sp.]|tara:strand:- start:1887 stop:2702 length:816 start_codon:yes stop_codon:yes gene_type:complete